MRPRFHFTASSGWINDPHGITARDGGYHAFYQYVPDSMQWAPNCHWGHATGPDLLSLTESGVAIAPGDGDDGIWTGALVTPTAGPARIFYTAVSTPAFGVGRVRTATPTDEEWGGWAKGPVAAEAPAEIAVTSFRDPFLPEEPDGSWRMFVGAALDDGSAAALAYRSRDLDSWEYEGIALQRSSGERDPVWTGSLWECPQIVRFGDRHVMISSIWDADVLHYAAYAAGSYADGRFRADDWARLTYGPSYYAPSYFRDSEGRACAVFWMRGVQDEEAGWAGAHSLPYVLELEGDVLVASPHPDVLRYRGPIAQGGVVAGLAADAEWTPGGMLVVQHGEVETARLRVEDAELTLQVGAESWGMPFDGGAVRVVVDGPVLEVSSRRGLLGAAIPAAGASVGVTADSELRVWPLER